MNHTITPLATASQLKADTDRRAAASAQAHDQHAQAALMHAAYARRVCAAELLKRGQPMTAESLAAVVDVDLHLVRAVLDGLVQDREIVQTGCLYAWPRRAA